MLAQYDILTHKPMHLQPTKSSVSIFWCLCSSYTFVLTANKANPEYTQSVLDIEDLVTLGQKHK